MLTLHVRNTVKTLFFLSQKHCQITSHDFFCGWKVNQPFFLFFHVLNIVMLCWLEFQKATLVLFKVLYKKSLFIININLIKSYDLLNQSFPKVGFPKNGVQTANYHKLFSLK